MKKNKRIIGYLSIAAAVISSLYGLTYTLKNPKLTQTELAIENWWVIPIVWICVLGFHYGFIDD